MSGEGMSHARVVAILAYHSIDDSGSVLSVAPRIFAEQMEILHEQGVRVVPLGEVRHVLGGTSVPEPLVAVTFDDGFRSVYEYGFPVLQRYGFAATVFLVTDYCGKANAWTSQPPYLERRPLLGWAEAREMSAAGIAFGSHTRTHPDLTTLTRRDAEEELIASKMAIEDAISRPVDALAYPYGAYDHRIKGLAQTHFALACSTTLGFVRPGSDLFALERLEMYYLRRPMVFERLFSPEVGVYVRLRRHVRDARQKVMGWLKRR